MSGKLTCAAYLDLIREDIEWLRSMPRTLEREHILAIVEESVRYYYPGARIYPMSVCKYCKEPVDKEGQVHAGGCGKIG